MPILNCLSFEDVAEINRGLNETKDQNHPIRQEEIGETFWDIMFKGLDAIDASNTRNLMFED